MAAPSYDVVVLGTGPSGGSVAKRCADSGMRVAIVETLQLGGVCALRGCNPKKVLVQAAALVERARASRGRLGSFPDVHLAWTKLMEFKREFTQSVPSETRQGLESAGVHVTVGQPEFESPTSLVVDGRRFQSKTFVIATGSTPRELSIPGADLVTTSDRFLELEEPPERSLFVGGGYVSFEFAHVLAAAEKRVAVWEQTAQPLASFDQDLVTRLVEHSRERGIAVATGKKLARIEDVDGELRAVDDKGEALAVDAVFHGAGRVPNLAGLRLDKAEIEAGEDGVVVDTYLRSTSNPRVFATGDCAASGHPALTPVANSHAHAVVQNLTTGEDRHVPDVAGVASVVFTVPPLAAAGLTESEAEKQDVEHSVRSGDMSSWGSVRKDLGDCAAYKLVLGSDDRILGAHLLGPGAAETINLFSLAIRAGLTAKEVKAAPLAFPTHGFEVRRMV